MNYSTELSVREPVRKVTVNVATDIKTVLTSDPLRRSAPTTCEECCKGDVSSISCNEFTPHTSSTSPTEICPLLAAVLWMASPIV